MAEHARLHNTSSTDGTSAVGRDLRAAREALGISVSQMADSLRIRAAHIEALEEGRFADLPGRPYTFGFARSIARHVGLDPDAVTARLRDEVMGTSTPAELVFPESTEDKRLSRTGWVLISIVAVLLAYGGWLAISSQTADRPAEFSSEPPSSPPSAAVGETPAAPPSTGSPAESANDQSGQGAQVAAPVPDSAPAAEAPGAATPAPAPRAEAPPAEPQSSRPPAAAPTPPSTAPATRAPATAAPPPRAPSAASGPVAGTPSAPRGAAPSAPGVGYNLAPQGETESQVDAVRQPVPSAAPAQTPPAGRIIIRAHQDSWVQVQAGNGATVFARTLRAGDSYTVPDQPGLRLTTGNAGGLDVIVDGQAVPSLGQIGSVRRNVSLDASRLKAGTALE